MLSRNIMCPFYTTLAIIDVCIFISSVIRYYLPKLNILFHFYVNDNIDNLSLRVISLRACTFIFSIELNIKEMHNMSVR